MIRPENEDELVLRYQEASAADPRRPADSVREAVRAHAQMLAGARQQDAGNTGALAGPPVPAANQSRWKMSMLASVAVLGLAGLLVLQMDRGTPQEKELVSGQQAPGKSSPPEPAVAGPAVGAARSDNTSADRAVAPGPPAARLEVADKSAAAPAVRPAQQERETKDVRTAQAARKAEPAPPVAVAKLAEQAVPAQAPVAPLALAVPALAPPAAPATVPTPPVHAAPAASPGRSADMAAATSGTATPVQAQSTGALALAPALRASSAARAAPVPDQPMGATLQAVRPRVRGPEAQDLAITLQQAARAGRVAQLDRLLLLGAPLNAPDETGKTPLMLAVINDHTDMVRRLLAAGADPALTDRDGLTALQHARKLGLERIATLIEAGP